MSGQYHSETIKLSVRHAEAVVATGDTPAVPPTTYFIGALFVHPPVRDPKTVATLTTEAFRGQPDSGIALTVDPIPNQTLIERQGRWGTLFHVGGASITGAHAEVDSIRELVGAANGELRAQAAAYDDAHPVRPADTSYYDQITQEFGYTRIM